jgi:hypothetical protein
VGQLSDPYEQGEDEGLGITIAGLPGDLLEPDPPADADSPADADASVDDRAPVDAPADVPTDDGGDGPSRADDGEEGEGLVYDLDDWSELERQAVGDRLREAGVPHGWDGTSLQVAAQDEGVVENILDIVEGEADEPLVADRDQVAYDLSEWDDDQAVALGRELRSAGIAFAWDGDEMYVYAEDEDAVDDLFDRVSHPDELAAEDDDGAIEGEVLGELFVAADRLQRDPDEPDGVLVVLDKGAPLDPERPPYGIGKPEWGHLCERVTDLADLLLADEVDEAAVMTSAGDLRTALRPYV